MSDGQALLQAILDDPDDHNLRLVYADWLDEHSDPRGEFIRVQIQLARLTPQALQWRDLWNRELALIRTYKEVWFGAMRKKFIYWECRRGFIDEVSAGNTVLMETMGELFRSHPVRRVSVSCSISGLSRLLESPLLARVSSCRLWVEPSTIEEGSVEAMTRVLDARPVGHHLHLHEITGGYVQQNGAPQLRRFDILLDERPVPVTEQQAAPA